MAEAEDPQAQPETPPEGEGPEGDVEGDGSTEPQTPSPAPDGEE